MELTTFLYMWLGFGVISVILCWLTKEVKNSDVSSLHIDGKISCGFFCFVLGLGLLGIIINIVCILNGSSKFRKDIVCILNGSSKFRKDINYNTVIYLLPVLCLLGLYWV